MIHNEKTRYEHHPFLGKITAGEYRNMKCQTPDSDRQWARELSQQEFECLYKKKFPNADKYTSYDVNGYLKKARSDRRSCHRKKEDSFPIDLRYLKENGYI